jgi:Bacterial PH domain
VRLPALELEAGEELRATTHASFRGAALTSVKATAALGSARMRQKAYEDWRHAVEAAGFPTAGPEMVLAVTNRRVLVCRTTFMMGRPSTIEGSVDLRRISDVATTRQGLVTGLAFALINGQVVEVEAMRGSGLRRFAQAVREALGR